MTRPAYDAALALRQARYYLRLGLHLTPVEYGDKLPVFGKGWNKRENLIATSEQAERWFSRPHNIGVHLGASRIVSFDGDDLALAGAAFAARGLDLDAFLDSHPYPIKGRGVRLWFREPEGCPITSRRAYQVDGVTGYEIRGGNGFQDVAPGSLHPDGFLYTWAKAVPRCREDLPELPAFLMDLYEALGQKPEKASRPAPVHPLREYTGESVIHRFNATYTVQEILERNGYKRSGSKYLGPKSSTGQAAVVLYHDGTRTRACTYHTSDTWSDDHGHDAFDLFTTLEHDGQQGRALIAARELLGMARPQAEAALTPEQVAATWQVGLGKLLEDTADALGAMSGHHHAKAALWNLLCHIYGQAADGHIAERGGQWVVMVGGLKGIKHALGGGGTLGDISARLKWAGDQGFLGKVERTDPAAPYSPLAIRIPADPANLPVFKLSREALQAVMVRPLTRAVRNPEIPSGSEETATPPTVPSKATPIGRVELLTRCLRPVLMAERRGTDLPARVRDTLRDEGLEGVTFADLRAELTREIEHDTRRRLRLQGALEASAAHARHIRFLARVGVESAKQAAKSVPARLRRVTLQLTRLADGEPMRVVIGSAA